MFVTCSFSLIIQSTPNRHMNVEATSWRYIDADTTLSQHCMLAGQEFIFFHAYNMSTPIKETLFSMNLIALSYVNMQSVLVFDLGSLMTFIGKFNKIKRRCCKIYSKNINTGIKLYGPRQALKCLRICTKNAQIQIILRKLSSGSLLSIHTFCSIHDSVSGQ